MAPRWVTLERSFDASPARVLRAWSDPEAMTTWFATEIEGSLAPGTRSTLIWPAQRTWIDVLEADPDGVFRFRWGWAEGDPFASEVTVTVRPRGYGSRLTLRDGPFDLDQPSQLDAYAEALAGWAESLANLRAQLDFSVDLRAVRGHTTAGPR